MYYRKSRKNIIGITLFCIGFVIQVISSSLIISRDIFGHWEGEDIVAVFLLVIVGGAFTLIGIYYMIRGYVENYLIRIFPPPVIPSVNVEIDQAIHLKPGFKYCDSCNTLISIETKSCPHCDVE